MAVTVGEAVGYLDLDISGFLQGLKTANTEAENKSKSLAEALGGGLQKAGGKMVTAGKVLTASVTTPIVSAGTAAVKTAADFDSSMSQVSAISGATGNDLQSLRDKALEMGAKTKFSASEAADAMNYMAMAGWKTTDMLGGIEGIMNLAAASGEDLATTSDIVTDALTAFGLSADDSGRFADILAAASANANTNVSMLGESFKYVAPVAGALGYSAEDTSLALGLMANAGIKASQGGTALRTMLTNLVNPTDEMAITISKLGLQLDDGEGNMLSFRNVMGQLRDGFGELKIPEEEAIKAIQDIEAAWEAGELTEKQYAEALEYQMEAAYGAEGALKAKAAADLAGKTGMSGLLAIINASDEDFNKLADAIDGSSQEMALLEDGSIVPLTEALQSGRRVVEKYNGAAEQMASVMQNNLNGRITILKSALEGLAIQIGEIIIPYVEKFVKKAQEVVEWLSNLSEEQKENVLRWAAIAAAIGPALLVAGKVIGVIGGVIKAFSGMSKAIKAVKSGVTLLKGGITGFATAITSPMTIVVGLVAAVAAAFVTLWTTNEEFREKMIAIWDGIKEKVSSFVKEISSRFGEFSISFESIVEFLKKVWFGFCDLLAPVFIAIFENISSVLGGLLDGIIGIVDAFIGLFTGDWKKFTGGLKKVWDAFWKTAKSIFNTYVNALKSLANVFFGWFGTNWRSVWNKAKEIVTTAWTNIKTSVKSKIDGVKSDIKSGLENAKETITSKLDSIKDKFESIFESCKTTVKTQIDKIKGFFNFSWSLPKLKMPHFKINGSFSLNPPSVPSMGVEWYAKAMNGGMILNRPTVFGYDSKTGKFLGAGEAGSEVIVGTNSLFNMIYRAVSRAMASVLSTTASDIVNTVRDNSTQAIDTEKLAHVLARVMSKVPIQNNVNVEMQDGNVYMDSERVGRKLAPVVSRIVAQGI